MTNSHLMKGRVEMNVKAEFAVLKGYPIDCVFQDTRIEAGDVVPLLENLSKIFGMQIPRRGKPRKGWRISTIVGFIYHNQEKFPLLN